MRGCDWAACHELGVQQEDGWWHCARHLRAHRADTTESARVIAVAPPRKATARRRATAASVAQEPAAAPVRTSRTYPKRTQPEPSLSPPATVTTRQDLLDALLVERYGTVVRETREATVTRPLSVQLDDLKHQREYEQQDAQVVQLRRTA